MQRKEAVAEGSDKVVIISCDFCRRDWDGQEPMVEGHHGSVICPECLDRAVREATPRGDEIKYQCNLCLRFTIPGYVPQWSYPGNLEAVVCEECIQQAATVLGKTLRQRARSAPKQPE